MSITEDVTEALKSARYNDLVHINVSLEDDDQQREIILRASLDAENGGILWNPLKHDSSTMMKHHLRTKRWFFPMLNDHRRNQLYDKAIRLASEDVVRRFSSSDETPADEQIITGLDIGSGTGLLAMLSAKHIHQGLTNLAADKKTSVEIKSLEMSNAMSQIAQQTVQANQLGHQIQVLERHSCEMDPLQRKAHLCTSELLESKLLGEGWLPAMRDAWERHLHPQAIVVPQRARLYAQIVQGDNSLCNYWGPHQAVKGFPENRQLKLWCTGGDGNDEYLLQSNGFTLEIHAKQLLADRDNPLRLLSDPIPILDFDVTSREAIPPTEGRTKTVEVSPIASGRAQGVLYWWELDLYGDSLTYSTHYHEEFQDHWHQCLFVFARAPEDCAEMIAGESVILKAMHDDSNIHFDVSSFKEKETSASAKRLKPNPADKKPTISPERAWQLNDPRRMGTIRNGISFAMQQVGMKTSIVLDVSDFSLGAVMAALLGAPKVYSIESSSGSLPLAAARIAQLANDLPLDKADPSSFQILQCHPEQLTTREFEGKQPNIVVAEPYYEVLEGWHLQEALNYFYMLRALKRRGVVSATALSVPASASIMICAFESSEIGRAYKYCDEEICGFQHDAINANAPLFDHDIVIPSWQYDITPLTKPVAVATIDYQACQITQGSTPEKVPIMTSGTCYGMLVWIDCEIPQEGVTKGVLSTRGRCHQQIVRLLAPPVEVSSTDVLEKNAAFSCRFVLNKNDDEDYDFEFGVNLDS